MRVIRADVLGMCFGVRDALAVIDGIDEPHDGHHPRPARAQRDRAIAARIAGFTTSRRNERGEIAAGDAIGLDHGARDQRQGANAAAARRQAD